MIVELLELKKTQARMKSVRAKMAPRIVQQTSVDHRLLSSTGNSPGADTSLLNICESIIKFKNDKFYLSYLAFTIPIYPDPDLQPFPPALFARQELFILHHRVMSVQGEGQSLVIMTNRGALRS